MEVEKDQSKAFRVNKANKMTLSQLKYQNLNLNLMVHYKALKIVC